MINHTDKQGVLIFTFLLCGDTKRNYFNGRLACTKWLERYEIKNENK